MSCQFVCTHPIFHAMAFNYLFVCLQKRGQSVTHLGILKSCMMNGAQELLAIGAELMIT